MRPRERNILEAYSGYSEESIHVFFGKINFFPSCEFVKRLETSTIMDGPIMVSKNYITSIPSLDLLAEVASATLKNDPSLTMDSDPKVKKKPISNYKLPPAKKACNSDRLTLDQIRMLSDKMLLEMFSEFTSDELRRNYSYKCFLIPEKCAQMFTSFGNEQRSRLQIKTHLLTHIAELFGESNGFDKGHYSRFTAEPLHVRRKRLQTDGGNKKKKQGRCCTTKKRKSIILQNQEPPKKSFFNIKNKDSKHPKYVNIKKNLGTNCGMSKYIKTKVTLATRRNGNSGMDNKNDTKSTSIRATASDISNVKPINDIYSDNVKSERNCELVSTFPNNLITDTKSCLKLCNNFSTKNQHLGQNGESKSVSGTNSGLNDCVDKHTILPLWNKVEKVEESEVSCNEQTSFTRLNELSKAAKVDVSSLKICIAQERNIQPYRDHCYTSTYGKLCDDKQNEIQEDIEKSMDITIRGIPVQFIIPTPPFPYVYVPLLPHISEIQEYGKDMVELQERMPFVPFGEGYEIKAVETKASQCSKQKPKEKLTRIRRVHKVIIPEEMEPDTEDDENNPSSLPIQVESINSDENNSGDIPDGHTSAKFNVKNLSEISPCQEKKWALRLIRALRTKKKDERGPLICQICKNKSFTAQATLMYHYRSHAGIKPFSCTVCDATFTRQHSLNYHMLIHNDKSRFICSDCGRKFRHPSHYKEHLRRHTGETPYECNDCDLRFKTRNTYKRHLKTRHGKILTAQGIRTLSVEEFYKVRTSPRKKAFRHSPVLKQDQETQWPEVAFQSTSQSIANSEMC